MSKDDLIDRLRIEPSVAEERRRPGWLLAAVALALVVAAVGWAWFSRAEVTEVQTLSPEMVDVGEGSSQRERARRFRLRGRARQATVAAEVTGKLTEVLVEEGLAVEQGQVLARMDDATEQAQLELARARLARGAQHAGRDRRRA